MNSKRGLLFAGIIAIIGAALAAFIFAGSSGFTSFDVSGDVADADAAGGRYRLFNQVETKLLSDEKRDWLSVNLKAIDQTDSPEFALKVLNEAYSSGGVSGDPVMKFSTKVSAGTPSSNREVNGVLSTTAAIINIATEKVEELGFSEVVVVGVDGNNVDVRVVDGRLEVNAAAYNQSDLLALGKFFGLIDQGVDIGDDAFLDFTSYLRKSFDYAPGPYDRFTGILPETLKTRYDREFSASEALLGLIDSGEGKLRHVETDDGYKLLYVETYNESGGQELHFPNVLNGFEKDKGQINPSQIRYLLANIPAEVMAEKVSLELRERIGDSVFATGPFIMMGDFTSTNVNPESPAVITIDLSEALEIGITKTNTSHEVAKELRDAIAR